MSNVHQLLPELRPRTSAKRRAKLSEEVCRTIGLDERVSDTAEPGFYGLGLKGGKVSLRVKADVPLKLRRFDFGRTVERVLGTWPELSPKAARPVAKAFIASIRRGVDPAPKNQNTPADLRHLCRLVYGAAGDARVQQGDLRLQLSTAPREVAQAPYPRGGNGH
jgi:hypothetical protein